MIKESLQEMIIISEYCVSTGKDPKIFGSEGCYGYPASILLLAIVDAIGTHICKGSTRVHFDILNEKDFYNLGLSSDQITTIYESYRCLCVHNAVLASGVALAIGKSSDLVFEDVGGVSTLRLTPFLELSKEVVTKFISITDSVVTTEIKKK